MDLDAWAQAELAKAAEDPGAFERRLKEALEQRLSGRRRFRARDNDGVWVEEVLLEGSYPATTGSIILRDDRQPDCRFAWDLGELWDWRAFQDVGADPEERAGWLEIYLDEDVEAVRYGIPIRCLANELTPVGQHEVSMEEAVRRAPFPVLVPSRPLDEQGPQVFYEERRRFFPFASVHLVYRSHDGLLVSCQTERLRQKAPDVGWKRVDRPRGDQTFVSWTLEHTDELRFTVWPLLDPVRTVSATFDGFLLFMQTDFLSEDELVEIATSVEFATEHGS